MAAHITPGNPLLWRLVVERSLVRGTLPAFQLFDREYVVAIDELSISLAQPESIGMMATLRGSQRLVVAGGLPALRQ
jgi:hypothetical protein